MSTWRDVIQFLHSKAGGTWRNFPKRKSVAQKPLEEEEPQPHPLLLLPLAMWQNAIMETVIEWGVTDIPSHGIIPPLC